MFHYTRTEFVVRFTMVCADAETADFIDSPEADRLIGGDLHITARKKTDDSRVYPGDGKVELQGEIRYRDHMELVKHGDLDSQKLWKITREKYPGVGVYARIER